jgi:recombination associated protein RdgC
MFFKNAQLYRLPAPWAVTPDELDGQLAKRAFHPCGAMDLASVGFVEPAEHSSHGLVHVVGGQYLITLGIEQKLLPASVINQEAEKLARQVEADQGFKPARKQMKEIKAAVTDELLPRAFTVQRRVPIWIDPVSGWLAVDASSRGAAEPAIEALHKALDEFPLRLLNTLHVPRFAMTNWLSDTIPPDGFSIGQDCVLEAVADDGCTIRYSRHSLDGDDVREHIAAGKLVASLALTFDDRVSFVLTDAFEIKRIEILDVVTEAQPDAEGRNEQFDADFMLMALELDKLFRALVMAMGGEVAV